MNVVRSLAVMAAVIVPLEVRADEPLQPTPQERLEELERKADELSDTARQTIEEFVNLIGPMLTRLSRLIDDLPVYEMPEVLPNGDIIMRRKPDGPAPVLPGETDENGLTET
jgi:hypothetical protein